MTDCAVWRDLVYLLFVFFPLAIATFVIAVTVWAVALAFVAVPFYYGSGSGVQLGDGRRIDVDTLPEAIACTLVGLGLLALLPWILGLLAAAHAFTVKTLLGRRSSERVASRNEANSRGRVNRVLRRCGGADQCHEACRSNAARGSHQARGGSRRGGDRGQRGWRLPDRAGRGARGVDDARGDRRWHADRLESRWRANHHSSGAAMRVVIAEDSVLLLEGLTRLLADEEIEVAEGVGDGDALVVAVEQHRPDLAIVDVRMPPTHTDEGLRAAIEARSRVPETAILVLSQYVEERYASDLLAAGGVGVGYLLKERVADVGEFIESVRRVAAGGTAFDPEVVAQLMGRRRQNDPLSELTPREREVLVISGF